MDISTEFQGTTEAWKNLQRELLYLDLIKIVINRFFKK